MIQILHLGGPKADSEILRLMFCQIKFMFIDAVQTHSFLKILMFRLQAGKNEILRTTERASCLFFKGP